MNSSRVGLVLGSEIPPERLRGMAASAEQQGFSEVWLSEDCFFTGGISGAALALGATSSIPVGLGVVSAVTRHPAVLAMEIATLARAFPGRLMPAVGLGVPAWLEQMGLQPPSSLSAVRECVASLRTLLDGGRIEDSSGLFTFDGIELAYPVAEYLPLQMGVAGPKMLQLSGSIAEGTLLSVLAGTRYVGWAREQIGKGLASRRSGAREHRVTTFALCAVDQDGGKARERARAAVAFYLAAGGPNAITAAYGINDQLVSMIEAGGLPAVQEGMPDAWVEDLAVAGDPDECIRQIERLIEAGSDQVALFPTPAEHADHTIDLVARHVLPHVDPRQMPSPE
jgi:alkanesulfonate monooxygenase SsuD/methylene tetrahydromethanopterin reductase-like flavin-dependent oxidoreductase (luciferase family)